MSSTVLTKSVLTSSPLAPASGSYDAWLAVRPSGAAIVVEHGTTMSRQGLIPAAVGIGADVCPDARHRSANANAKARPANAKAIDEPVVTFTRLRPHGAADRGEPMN